MGATNRKDVLDAALTRPGRFDRSIEVRRPDFQGRLEAVKVAVGTGTEMGMGMEDMPIRCPQTEIQSERRGCGG